MTVQLTNPIISIWSKTSEACLQHLVKSIPQGFKAALNGNGVLGILRPYLVFKYFAMHECTGPSSVEGKTTGVRKEQR